MNKGSTVLKIAGFLLGLFGILNVLWAMSYGFLGALGFSKTEQTTILGLFIFYGFFGIVNGIFQFAVASVCVRHAKVAEHWLRCVVWGLVILAMGVLDLLAFFAISGGTAAGIGLLPQWFGLGVTIGNIILPLLAIAGGLLNRPSPVAHKG